MPDTPSDAQMYRAHALAQGNNRLANALAYAGFDLLDQSTHLPALMNVWAEWCPDEVLRVDLWGIPAWRVAGITPFIHERLDTLDCWIIEGHARDCIERAGYDVETGRTRLAELDTRHATAFRTRFASDADREMLHAHGNSPAVALVTLRLLDLANR